MKAPRSHSIQWSILLVSLLLTTPARAQSTSTTKIIMMGTEEKRFMDLINRFRTSLGLPSLQIHVTLQQVAASHSDWMADHGILTHYGPLDQLTPFERMRNAGYEHYTYAGENIACGNADALQTFIQWAYSPGHLENMLSPHFHHMGIARSGTGKEQCPYYWTNDFGSFDDPELDPKEVTDQTQIKKAILAISNSAPIPASTSNQSSAEQDAPALGLPNSITCLVPYNLGKGVFTTQAGLDSRIEITRILNQTFNGKISYFQNGAASSYYPVNLGEVQVSKSIDFPLITVFSAPGNRVSGFSLLINLKTFSAQLDTFPNKTEVSGTLSCSLN
jgi:uncharacterized protein YkwD